MADPTRAVDDVAAWRARMDAWRRYEEGAPAAPPRSAADALAAATWLYDLLPAESRTRAVDVSGIARMRACLAVLTRRS